MPPFDLKRLRQGLTSFEPKFTRRSWLHSILDFVFDYFKYLIYLINVFILILVKCISSSVDSFNFLNSVFLNTCCLFFAKL